MLVAVVAGYGRRAYGACDPIGGATYQCSGANAATQTITANNADVSTIAGFSVNAAAGNAITITGAGALIYTDSNASSLTAAGYALYVRSIGDYAGTTGSVTINTNGAITGGFSGINARNNSTGATTITVNGDVTATSGNGIYTRNLDGSNLTVTTGTGTTVRGSNIGIYAINVGTAALTITANGNVIGTYGIGIYTRNDVNGTALSVTTAAGTTVSGSTGISANNRGTGALTITASGDVTGSGLSGISARNSTAGTALSVTAGAGTTVSGAGNGVSAYNYGTGALTVTANGNVTGTSGRGIYALNAAAGTTVSVTTAAGTTVSGSNRGINARNFGTGALTITANGNVTATGGSGRGIYAQNFGNTLSVTTGAGTAVSGTSYGIGAKNLGTGALTITANGNVTATGGSGRSLYARNYATGADLFVTTNSGATVSGSSGIFARNSGTGALTVSANGNVTGTGSDGIFAQNDVNGTSLTVTTGAGTTVSGASNGINAVNIRPGALNVIVNGDVTGTNGRGIFARHYGTDLSVTTGAGATVSGGTDGIFARNSGSGTLAITAAATGTVNGGSGFGIQALDRAATVTVAGTVNGGAGGAINFDQVSAFANRLELKTGAVINGNVFGGTGTDTLGLSGTSSGSFNIGQLTSFEAGQKTESGTWTLTGSNSGIGTFSVNGGTLAVNGSLASTAMTVNAGGTLGGTGTVGATTIASGGSLAAGNSIGTLTVQGNLTFNAGATYTVDVSPMAADRTDVTGSATLTGGTVNAVALPGSFRAQTYTILNATGGFGGTQFAAITGSSFSPGARNPHLTYDANNVFLVLDPGTIELPAGTGGNQAGVAGGINSAVVNGGTPPVGFNALLNMTGAQLINALSQVSGQPGASTAQTGMTATNQFANAIFDSAFGDDGRQGDAIGFAHEQKVLREAEDAYAAVTPRDRRAPAFEQRWNVWASAYGGNSRVNGDAAAGTNTTNSRIFGTAAGATYRGTPNTQLGFALGGAGTNFGLDGGFGGGKADVFNAAVYARHNFGSAYLAGLLGYSWQDTTTDRTVTIAGTDQLRANFKAQALSARLEGGWRYATPALGITPYAALQSTAFYLPSYGETAVSGTTTFALNYASKTMTATRSELGVRFDKAIPLAMLVQNGVFTLKAKTAWAHDWNTERAANATFQALPGASFTTNGAQPSANAALLSLGAEMKWHNGWSLAGSFDGEFSRTTASYAGKGTVRYAW